MRSKINSKKPSTAFESFLCISVAKSVQILRLAPSIITQISFQFNTAPLGRQRFVDSITGVAIYTGILLKAALDNLALFICRPGKIFRSGALRKEDSAYGNIGLFNKTGTVDVPSITYCPKYHIKCPKTHRKGNLNFKVVTRLERKYLAIKENSKFLL